ncbi:MAG: hypothetical protein HRT88_20105 [Lentisphaeraceae bacterium]|nr:hypothetical protein [Lentisphaeraceae bacterium]
MKKVTILLVVASMLIGASSAFAHSYEMFYEEFTDGTARFSLVSYHASGVPEGAVQFTDTSTSLVVLTQDMTSVDAIRPTTAQLLFQHTAAIIPGGSLQSLIYAHTLIAAGVLQVGTTYTVALINTPTSTNLSAV